MNSNESAAYVAKALVECWPGEAPYGTISGVCMLDAECIPVAVTDDKGRKWRLIKGHLINCDDYLYANYILD